MNAERQRLERLATLYGVDCDYIDALGQERTASDAALLATLRALGAEVQEDADVERAIAQREVQTWRRLCDEVAVVWGDTPAALVLRLPADTDGDVDAEIRWESGETHSVRQNAADLELVDRVTINGRSFESRRLELGGARALGYHQVDVRCGDQRAHVTLIAAPQRAPLPEAERAWGAFLPLYALRSADSLGIGSCSDLVKLIELIKDLGGNAVGTLPLLSAFLDAPCENGPREYSPYAPVSRLFWNELYLDPRACPELERCEPAQQMLKSERVVGEAAALMKTQLVDYDRQYALLRPIFEALSECFFAGDTAELDAYEEAQPRAREYARFRAAVEQYGAPHGFPPSFQLESAELEEARIRYHLYVQMRMTEQLGRAHEAAADLGVGLYLDMPLGVHPDGYDALAHGESFLSGLSAGAPPDPLFTGGQNWGLKPLSPDGLRRTGLRYLRDCLAHQMSGSAVLRVDHVMGLHRIYCVPDGFGATEGVYVRMPHEAIYATVLLESHRHGTCLVGEDLGTVPDAVREAMDRHALMRMYVLPFELRPHESMILGKIPQDAVASLNTHDMPSFLGWWEGADLDVQQELGLIDESQYTEQKQVRHALTRTLAERFEVPHEPAATMEACLLALASSESRLLLINLEDLWLEEDPQNVPGTHRERPNWRRKARLSLEEMREDARVRDILGRVDALRREHRR